MACVIVFAREPRRGRVKTRLAPFLNDAAIEGLYRCFVRDTLATVRRIRGAAKIVAFESSGRTPVFLKGDLPGREILVGPRCLSCTAGSGSSCQGALT